MRPFHRFFSRLLALGCAGIVASFGALGAPIPPQPVAAALTVARGSRLEVPLRIYGAATEEPRYLIRSSPEHGKLSAPRIDDRHRVSVLYEPPADLGIKTDHFTYAAQTSAGVSAPAEVTITIVDEVSRLVVPAALEFGEAAPGMTTRREFEILNRGGSVAEGQAVVDPPWQIEGDSGYRLAPWQSRKITVVFKPLEKGRYEGQMRYTSEPNQLTTLRAQGIAALTLAPNPLVLAIPSDGSPRRGAATVANHTATDLIVKVQGPGRLQFPSELILPANGQSTLAVQTLPADTASLHADLKLTAAGAVYSLPVSAEALAPALQVPAGPLRLSVGKAMPLTVRNGGGRAGVWTCEVPAPFSVSPAQFQLAPGEQLDLAIRCETTTPGEYRTVLRLSGGQPAIDLMLEASVADESIPATPAQTARPAPSLALADAPPPATAPEDPIQEEPPRAIVRSVPGVIPVARTDHSVVLQFPAALAGGRPLRVKKQDLWFDECHQFQTAWRNLPSASFKTEGGTITLEIWGLRPHTLQPIRVEAATDGAEVFTTEVSTLPAQPVIALTPLRVLLLALLGLLGYLAWQKIRPA